MDINSILQRVKVYFNLLPDKVQEQVIIEQISSGVSFRGANLWVLIFAIFIASLGLNVNSTAVIIGAMLISPLMGPIIGMGLAVGINDLDLLKRSAKNFGVATLISVLTALVYFLITPLGEAQSELLARTSPTLYDVLIAFCGGAAGIIAICTGGKGNIIPGVAIATALMPPLCTAGYGLATGHFLFFLGAFYLFFINTVFIALATYAGVRFMKFQQHTFASSEQGRRARRIMMGLVVVTMLPAIVLTTIIVHKNFFENNLQRFVKTELSQAGTQILSADVEDETLRIVAVGREITADMQSQASRRMEQYGLGSYTLNVIQGVQTDSLLRLNHELTQMSSSRDADHHKLLQATAENARLSQELTHYTRFEQLTADMRDELAALFPQVATISLAPVAESSRDTTVLQHFVSAIVTADTRFTAAEEHRLHDWLQVRVKTDSLVLLMQIKK